MIQRLDNARHVVVDDWRIAGRSLSENFWQGLHFPIRSLPIFRDALDKVLTKLGPHKRCLEHVDFYDPSCPFAVAFLLWWTLWGTPPRYEHITRLKEFESSICHAPFLVSFRSSEQILGEFEDKDTSKLVRKSPPTKRDQQTIRACLDGTFAQFVQYATHHHAGYGFNPSASVAALSRDPDSLFVPVAMCSRYESNEECPEKRISLFHCGFRNHLPETIGWRFREQTRIVMTSFEGAHYPELVARDM